MQPVVMVRPLPIRVAAVATLVMISVWALLNGDLGRFGTIAYPAIIALQTYREFQWRLEISPRGLHERQGIGSPRDIAWKSVESLQMPDAKWWRVNPVLVLNGAPNVQLTAAPEMAELIAVTRKRKKPLEGDVASIALIRSMLPWMILIGLASLLMASELAALA